jgi:Tfp pilus assembly protein PilO
MTGNIRDSKHIRQLSITFGSIIVVLILYMVFIHAPRRREIKEITDFLTTIDTQLEGVKTAIGQKTTLEEGTVTLKGDLEELANKFIDKEQVSVVLTELSDLANSLNLRIVSIDPSRMQEVANVKLDGQPCLAIPIKLSLKGSYEDFGDYLEALVFSKNGIFTIERFDILKEKRTQADLTIKLAVNAYVFDINR